MTRARSAPAWRLLGWFWLVVAVVAVGGGVALQALGPPRAPPSGVASAPPAEKTVRTAATPTTPVAVPAPAPTPAAMGVPGTPPPGGPIAAPDAVLISAQVGGKGPQLPRIGPDGRKPMQAYAGGFNPQDTRPRIALIMDGIGLSGSASMAAITVLPPAVTLAVSPYARAPEPLLVAARAAGHELLISIPMEPHRYPLNDEGDHALLTTAPAAQNSRRLDWALSRIQGTVGATGALDGMNGERFGSDASLMAPVLAELRTRGLLYVAPIPGAPPTGVWGRSADVVIPHAAGAAAVQAKLAALVQIARAHGAAVGIVGPPDPKLLDRLVAWSRGLGALGLVLAPVTAVALPPKAAP